MSDKIRVRIVGSERVTYNQEVLMTQEQYDALDTELTSDDRKVSNKAVEKIEGWLDLNDVSDWDDFELDDFCIVGTQDE